MSPLFYYKGKRTYTDRLINVQTQVDRNQVLQVSGWPSVVVRGIIPGSLLGGKGTWRYLHRIDENNNRVSLKYDDLEMLCEKYMDYKKNRDVCDLTDSPTNSDVEEQDNDINIAGKDDSNDGNDDGNDDIEQKTMAAGNDGNDGNDDNVSEHESDFAESVIAGIETEKQLTAQAWAEQMKLSLVEYGQMKSYFETHSGCLQYLTAKYKLDDLKDRIQEIKETENNTELRIGWLGDLVPFILPSTDNQALPMLELEHYEPVYRAAVLIRWVSYILAPQILDGLREKKSKVKYSLNKQEFEKFAKAIQLKDHDIPINSNNEGFYPLHCYEPTNEIDYSKELMFNELMTVGEYVCDLLNSVENTSRNFMSEPGYKHSKDLYSLHEGIYISINEYNGASVEQGLKLESTGIKNCVKWWHDMFVTLVCFHVFVDYV